MTELLVGGGSPSLAAPGVPGNDATPACPALGPTTEVRGGQWDRELPGISQAQWGLDLGVWWHGLQRPWKQTRRRTPPCFYHCHCHCPWGDWGGKAVI